MKLFLFFIAHLIGITVFAQDTAFVRSLPLDSAVRNIDSDGELLYLRFEQSFYIWKENELSFVQEGKFKYSWVNFDGKRNEKVISHSDFIRESKINSAERLANLIPGVYNYTTTTALLGDYLYVCYNGIVLEYKITPGFTRIHRGNSIRHIYTEPGFRVISTYNGIFIDTIFDQFSNMKMDEKIAKYSNGEFVKIDSVYYLCQDNLITYNRVTKDLKTIINTEGTPRFRRLLKYNNKVYALYNNAFGDIDLKTFQRDYMINDELSDFTEFNGKLYISSLNSVLYELDRQGSISEYGFKAPINDLATSGNDLLIGTGLGLYSKNDSTIVEVIPNTEVVQVLSYEGKIIFSNNEGLYYFFEGVITPLIENIEFNKMALHQDQHYLYAGSVNGLYVIKNSQLSGIIQDRPFVLKKNNSIIYFILIPLTLIMLIVALIVIRKRKQQKKHDYLTKKKTIIDSQLIRNVVISNPGILSVGQLAEYLDTSVVQINRHLKKEKTTGLALLRSTMKEIAIEMYKKGNSLEEISKRVGYSKRYIKANFFKE